MPIAASYVKSAAAQVLCFRTFWSRSKVTGHQAGTRLAGAGLKRDHTQCRGRSRQEVLSDLFARQGVAEVLQDVDTRCDLRGTGGFFVWVSIMLSLDPQGPHDTQ